MAVNSNLTSNIFNVYNTIDGQISGGVSSFNPQNSLPGYAT